MTQLSNYLRDGAGYQSRAVLMFLQPLVCRLDDDVRGDIYVSRWENCREQGYVVQAKSSDYSSQLNIAFFEHRNSDEICAVVWEQLTLNSPTIDTADFKGGYKGKWDVSHSVPYKHASDMAEYIYGEIEKFYNK